MLWEWNETQRPEPAHQGIHELFVEQVGRTPHATAVSARGGRLTYAQLEARSNQLARALVARGVGSDSLVGLCTKRTVDMVVGLLGILKAGEAYVPIDPMFPQDRIALMLDDSRARTLVTHRELSEQLPTSGLEALVLMEELPEATDDPGPPGRPRVTPEQLAYVIYTSGSTGTPKGVQISHRALTNFLISMQRRPGMSSTDTLLAVTTLSFDIAGLELFLPLVTGGRVDIATSDDAADADRLIERLEECDTTIMQATPTTWRMLLEAGWSGKRDLKILCGGEALPRDLIAPLLDRCRELWNMYGPTETTIWSSLARITSPDDVVSIGRPIDNTQMYVLDDWLNPVPCGVTGELYIGGQGLARGYLRRPELTEGRFVPNPHGRDAWRNDRIYRTGDLARYLPDGRIECLGRTDQQVKVRGFRIELGEIESVLSSHPAVANCAVVVREASPGDRRLVCCLVPRDGSEVDSQVLREHLRQRLPDYMVPHHFVTLQLLPLTPNGKVDRRSLLALEDPFRVQPSDGSTAPDEGPRDGVELTLSNLWKALLGVKRVRRRDNFFDLGGHSLMAVRLLAKIESVYGRRLPLATLMQAPTIETLADVLRGEDVKTSWESLVPIHSSGSKPPLFCIHAAGGNVLLYRSLARRLGPDQPVYGLQAQGLDGRQPYLTSVEAMAAHYLEQIRQLQPEGPYFLCGYCLGGTIAYEIAQQLRAHETDVALLALFDTQSQWSRSGLVRWLVHGWQRMYFHAANLMSHGPQGQSEFLSDKFKEARLRISQWYTATVSTLAYRLKLRKEHPLVRLERINDHASETYRPRPYHGSLTVFRPRTNYAGLTDPRLGWSEELTPGGLEVVELPVYPAGMLMEPFVKVLARELGRRIDRLDMGRDAQAADSPDRSEPVVMPITHASEKGSGPFGIASNLAKEIRFGRGPDPFSDRHKPTV